MSQEQARKPQPQLQHQEELEEASGDRNVREKETDLPGSAMMSGFVGEQVVKQYSDRAPMSTVTPPSLSEPTERDEDKTKIADVLANATSRLPADKPATRRDAEGVTVAWFHTI